MDLPLLLQPAELAQHLGQPKLLVVDTSRSETYLAGHIPGAVHIPPAQLQLGEKPAPGKIPTLQRLSELFSGIGLTADTHVVACDDEGSGWAGRLLWTLEAIGHRHYSLLDGGLLAWQAEQRPLQAGNEQAQPSQFTAAAYNPGPIAEIADIIPFLGQPDFAIWDARSREEYEGSKVLAARGGHIPGAFHLEWTDLMDKQNHLRLLPLADIKAMLHSRGVNPSSRIVTHCQSHHRSGLTWIVGKILGLDIKAYHGSWGEWGNREDTPIVTGATP